MEYSTNANIEFIEELVGESEAAISLNPLYQWVKIVVCDDQPNLNKERIPLEEFDNVLKTGVNSPIKMSEGAISAGHKEAHGKVIGTITHLIKENNMVKAIGALWKRERPEDIAMLKDMYAKNELPQVSWELGYTDQETEADGIKILKGVVLEALAIVARPAYAGRTPIYAMASHEVDEEPNLEVNTNVDELEQLKQQFSELETKYKEAQTLIESLTGERDSLAEYKNTIEAEKAEVVKLASIKTKFKEAEIEKSEDYFTQNKDRLLKLDEDELDFMVQEIASGLKVSESSTTPPPFNTHSTKSLNPKELAEALRARKSK